jgi:hypothetical protein
MHHLLVDSSIPHIPCPCAPHGLALSVIKNCCGQRGRPSAAHWQPRSACAAPSLSTPGARRALSRGARWAPLINRLMILDAACDASYPGVHRVMPERPQPQRLLPRLMPTPPPLPPRAPLTCTVALGSSQAAQAECTAPSLTMATGVPSVWGQWAPVRCALPRHPQGAAGAALNPLDFPPASCPPQRLCSCPRAPPTKLPCRAPRPRRRTGRRSPRSLHPCSRPKRVGPAPHLRPAINPRHRRAPRGAPGGAAGGAVPRKHLTRPARGGCNRHS